MFKWRFHLGKLSLLLFLATRWGRAGPGRALIRGGAWVSCPSSFGAPRGRPSPQRRRRPRLLLDLALPPSLLGPAIMLPASLSLLCWNIPLYPLSSPRTVWGSCPALAPLSLGYPVFNIQAPPDCSCVSCPQPLLRHSSAPSLVKGWGRAGSGFGPEAHRMLAEPL